MGRGGALTCIADRCLTLLVCKCAVLWTFYVIWLVTFDKKPLKTAKAL